MIEQTYVRAISFIVKKYPNEGSRVAIDETVNFAEKLGPYLNPATTVFDEIATTLSQVCSLDSYNGLLLKKFVEEHGEKLITWEGGMSTTIKRELVQNYPDLVEMALEAKILT